MTSDHTRSGPRRQAGRGWRAVKSACGEAAATLLRGQAAAMLLRGQVVATLLVVACCGTATAAAGDLELLVARLDTVHSASDSVIVSIASRGDAVIPLVLEKLSSERRMTALGAKWVLTRLASDASLLPLLERWSGAKEDGERSSAADALHMVLRKRAGAMREPAPEPVGAEFQELGRAVLCSPDALGEECAVRGEAAGGPALLIYGEGIGPGYDLACGSLEVQVLPSGAFRESSYLVERRYVRMDMSIHDLPRATSPMPSWLADRRYVPDALALVRVTCGTVGPDETNNEYGLLWARLGGGWTYLERLYHMSVN